MIFKTQSGSLEVDLAKIAFIAATAYIVGSYFRSCNLQLKDSKANQREAQQLKRRIERILDRFESE